MPKKILVVEDNEQNRILLKHLLAYHGYEVVEAADGAEGIEAAKKYKPDLILMDLQMPVMDGFTAIRILKNDPKTKGIKIIAVTAFAMKGDRERALETGADAYISKPIDIKQLPNIVRQSLEG